MKVLFLDIDGVLNSAISLKHSESLEGIDPFMAFQVGRIVDQTDCKVVLSSSWRNFPASKDVVEKKVVKLFDVTPNLKGLTSRGTEIKQWLSEHPEAKKYAILDDNTDFLDEQQPSLFKTLWDEGITKEIADKIIAYLNTGI